jgi:hypothetical protein
MPIYPSPDAPDKLVRYARRTLAVSVAILLLTLALVVLTVLVLVKT